MTPLARAVLDAATEALADRDHVPPSAAALVDYREDARAVAVAVLIALGDFGGQHSLDSVTGSVAHHLLELADEPDNDAV